MELIVRRLQFKNGRVPFDDWFDSLDDPGTQAVVTSRITRLRSGNLGDYKSLGGGKRTQSKDVKSAQRLWKEFTDETAGLS